MIDGTIPNRTLIETTLVSTENGYDHHVPLVDAFPNSSLQIQLDRIEEKLDRILADLER